MQSLLRGIAAAAATAVTAGVLVAAAPPAAAATPPVPVSAGVVQAVRYANAEAVRAGVAVLDERTGTYYGAGADTRYFGSASVMKLFVATRLLATRQMTGWKAVTAYDMITRSNDDALAALLPYVGGTSVITWVQGYYHLPFLGTTTWKSWCWGNTHITAKGIVYFYRAMQHDPVVAPWLVNALNHHQTYGADGTNQDFGIPSATGQAGVKQGWGQCSSDMGGSIINSTGIVQRGRYAIAILTETTGGHTNGNSYNAWQAGIATTMARDILPDGLIDLPVTHNPSVRITATATAGNVVTISGTALDPDARAVTVNLYDGRTRVASVRSGGRFTAQATIGNGRRVLCAVVGNVSYGTVGSVRACTAVTVNGAATGGLNPATIAGSKVTLTGWAYDPDARGASTRIQVLDGATVVGTYLADGPSPYIDRVKHITGNHRFAVTVANVPDGTHAYTVHALNYGSNYSPAQVNVGTDTVTLHNNPVVTIDLAATATGSGTPALEITGFAYDPNGSATPLTATVSVDGGTAVNLTFDQASDAQDTAAGVTGAHGLDQILPNVAPGTHTAVITVANIGAGADTVVSRTITIPQPSAPAGLQPTSARTTATRQDHGR